MAKLVLDPPSRPRLEPAARARLDALSDEAVEALQAGDPDAAPPAADMLERAVNGRRVRRLRETTGLDQDAFARRFGIPPDILRAWEEGAMRLDATSSSYLTVGERDPEAVLRALGAA